MSWTDKQHKKQKIHGLVEQAMKDPRFQEAQKRQIEDATREAFDSFLLISADYLHRNHRYGKNGLLKYIDFVVGQMQFVQKDPEYFKLLNEALADETGVNILENVVN
ncbi:MAG: hypothetical protein H2212_00125 [Ruminococcus sp.]|nr:hypothetical protein [Ruminococcus sp.]